MRKLLAALAVVVVAGIAFLMLRLQGSPAVAPPTTGAAAPAASAAPTLAPGPLATQGKPVHDHRSSAAGRGVTSPEVGAGRDAGPAVAPEPRPRDEATAASPVQPDLVAHTRLAMRPVFRRCAREFAAELGPDKPAVTARVDARIEGGALTIGKLDLATHGVPADGELVACIRRGLEDFALPVAGHVDVASHAMTFPFDLPLP